MVSLSVMNLQGFRPTPASPIPEPKSTPPGSDTIPSANSEPYSERQARKFKSSSQLNRWSMARALRSGRKLERPGHWSNPSAGPTRPVQKTRETSSLEGDAFSENGDGEVDVTAAKSIYMVSDGTGWTAENSVNAALGQFEHCLVDRGCPVNTHLFSGIEDGEKLIEIIKQAAKDGAMLIYTLADPSMAESAKKACNLWNVPSTDILGPITEAISSHLGVTPSGLPRGKNTHSLNEDYFKRIEAIEFTIKQDDGALPDNLHKADIVLVGVSRTGKTPLSTYLAQKGYKVANIPIVMSIDLPKNLFQIDQRKIFGLMINPIALQAIREARARSLGFGLRVESTYSKMDCVREELEFARKIFAQNPTWPVIEVTERAVEETAAIILRLYHDRQCKYSMPRISKRY